MNNKNNTLSNGAYPLRWKALAVLCAAQFMVIMDTSIIGVALPAIQQALNFPSQNLHWIFNAYVIVFGGLLILGGKFSDIFGPKKIFLLGFVLLTISSLFTGIAWSELSLNAGRAIQGLSAALIAPSALTLLMTMFQDPKEVGKALGFWGASAAAGGSAGVFLGGVLTDFLSWRWTFFINIPIGILVLIFGSSLLLKGQKQKGSIDIIGSLLLTAAISLLVYVLVTMESGGLFSSSSLTTLGAAILAFVLFVFIQKNKKDQLIPFSLFKVKNLVSANWIMALLAGAWIPLWFFFNLFLQNILGFSAFESGLALLPMTIAIMILMVFLSGKIVATFGIKGSIISGLILLTLSLVWFAFLPANSEYFSSVIWPSLLAASGMSMAYVPATMASLSGAKPEEAGIASGLVNSTYQVGSAIGLAIAVAVSSYAASKLDSEVSETIKLIHSYSKAFITAACLSALATLIAAFGLKK